MNVEERAARPVVVGRGVHLSVTRTLERGVGVLTWVEFLPALENANITTRPRNPCGCNGAAITGANYHNGIVAQHLTDRAREPFHRQNPLSDLSPVARRPSRCLQR